MGVLEKEAILERIERHKANLKKAMRYFDGLGSWNLEADFDDFDCEGAIRSAETIIRALTALREYQRMESARKAMAQW